MNTVTRRWNQAFAELYLCPYCGSESWHNSYFDPEGESYVACCNTCKNRWWDLYQGVDYVPLNQPDFDALGWNSSFAVNGHCPYCGTLDWEHTWLDEAKQFLAECLHCDGKWLERCERLGFQPYDKEDEGSARIAAYYRRPVALRWLTRTFFKAVVKMKRSIRDRCPRRRQEESAAMTIQPLDTPNEIYQRLARVRREAERYRLYLLRTATTRQEALQIAHTPWHRLDDHYQEESLYVLQEIRERMNLGGTYRHTLQEILEDTSPMINIGPQHEQDEIIGRWEVVEAGHVNWRKEGF